MVERVEKKPSLWKSKCLSFGGKIILIKAALSNLLVLSHVVFKCRLCGFLDHTQRNNRQSKKGAKLPAPHMV